MAPIRLGGGTGLAPSGFAEWRKGDGTAVWSAGDDPDGMLDSEADQKLVHRWVLDDVASGTVADSVGSADGTVNGITSVDGNYVGGSAGDGDGSSAYIETTPWGGFGSQMAGGSYAFAFSIEMDATGYFFGVENTNNTNTAHVHNSGQFDTASAGPVAFSYRNAGDLANIDTISGSTDVTSGGPYRVVVNVTGTAPSDIDIYLNQSDDNASVDRNDGDMTQLEDFNQSVSLFARHDDGGGFTGFADTVMDDVCVFGESLTQTEIASYSNPWN